MGIAFRDIPGHEKTIQKILDSVQSGKVPHALMLISEEGAGGLPIALALARHLHCQNATTEDACGSCISCRQWENWSHPDVHFTYPIVKNETKKIVKSKDVFDIWRNALSENPYLTPDDWLEFLGEEKKKVVIHKEEALSIHHDMSLKSFAGGKKINIVWRPELFNSQSGNLLLKLIEEPPGTAQFIFISSKPDDILTTIFSRTQTIKLKTPNIESIAAHLKEKGIQEETAKVAAAAANGNLRKAQLLCLNPAGDSHFTLFRDWMRMCFKIDIEGLQKWILECNKMSRDALQSMLVYSLNCLHNCVWVKFTGKTKAIIHIEEEKFIEKFSSTLSMNAIENISKHIEDAIADIMWNGNVKIILQDLSFKINKTFKS